LVKLKRGRDARATEYNPPMALLINGERVDDAVLDSEFSGIKAYFERLGNVSCCERNDEFRGYARQNIIARVLLTQEALRTHLPVSEAQVEEAISKLKEENGGEQSFYQSIGAGPEQMDMIRRDVELNLRVRSMLEQLAANDPDPTDAELRAYYEQHIDSYKTLEEVRASHILKAPARGEQREAAYQALRDVRRQLLAGDNFDELAKLHSDKAQDHIDLGFFKRGELAEEFELVAFSMEVGELSPVFASPFGFHLLKLTERKPATPKPFEEIREQVREHFLQERQQEHTRKLVEALQAKAVIEDEVPAPVG
jgi:parvulin-like peptidyl-prolyl isomerase